MLAGMVWLWMCGAQRVPAGGLHRQFLAKFLRGRKLFPGNLFNDCSKFF